MVQRSQGVLWLCRMAILAAVTVGIVARDSAAAEALGGGKFVPPEGKVLLIVGQDKTTVVDYIAAIGQIPAGTMLYTSVQSADGLEQPSDQGGGLQHGQYLVDTYPDTVLQIGLYMVDALERVASGELDGNIDAIGSWIKKSGRPVFLRIGYEFDYPANHYAPAAYQQAYKHIVDRMRQQGVWNVAFVWHSYANLPEHPWQDWYPGDDYVDWVGISVFGRPNIYMDKLAEFAREHHKPLMVAEATPYGLGTGAGEASWQAWFAPFFRFVDEKGVRAISYINCNWETIPMFQGQGWGDARVQANDRVKARWLEETRQEKYLQSSSGLYKILDGSSEAPAAPGLSAQ